MSALRRHVVVRLMACWLLTWAAADLFVPDLCSGEDLSQAADESKSPDPDDCFCCCAHTEGANLVRVVFAEDIAPFTIAFHADDLAAGVRRPLYRPPLSS